MHLTKIKIFALVGFLVVFSFLAIRPAQAVQLPCTPSPGAQAQNDVFNCVDRLYRFGLVAATIAAVFMIILAGYLYIFSGGSESRVGTAKSFISTSLIGLAVLVVGYLILQQINPEILDVKNINPGQIGSVALNYVDYELGGGTPSTPTPGAPRPGSGGERNLGSYTGGDGSKPGPNQSAQDLGCLYDSQKQRNEVPQMTAALYSVVKEICKAVPGARISSVVGQGAHTSGSLHYSGCAIDFGNDTNTADGKKIMDLARSKGLVINPGKDANQTFHIHISLGSYCGKTQ